MAASPSLAVSRVLLGAIPSLTDVQLFLPALEQALERRRVQVEKWQESPAPASLEGIDLVLVLGGDGFLMHVIRSLGYPPVPFYGVNYGRVGFLMNAPQDADRLADRLVAGRFTRESYPVLSARLTLLDGSEMVDLAFNDLVLERASKQTAHLLSYIDGVLLNRYSGDGLIVASPAGSTAYSLAAGGPVVHNAVDSMIVTPLCPHRPVQFHSLQFPLVLPLETKVRIQAQEVDSRPLRCVADGRGVERVSSVTVTYAGRRVELLRGPDYGFIDTLVRKIIGWDSSAGEGAE